MLHKTKHFRGIWPHEQLNSWLAGAMKANQRLLVVCSAWSLNAHRAVNSWHSLLPNNRGALKHLKCVLAPYIPTLRQDCPKSARRVRFPTSVSTSPPPSCGSFSPSGTRSGDALNQEGEEKFWEVRRAETATLPASPLQCSRSPSSSMPPAPFACLLIAFT